MASSDFQGFVYFLGNIWPPLNTLRWVFNKARDPNWTSAIKIKEPQVCCLLVSMEVLTDLWGGGRMLYFGAASQPMKTFQREIGAGELERSRGMFSSFLVNKNCLQFMRNGTLAVPSKRLWSITLNREIVWHIYFLNRKCSVRSVGNPGILHMWRWKWKEQAELRSWAQVHQYGARSSIGQGLSFAHGFQRWSPLRAHELLMKQGI